jgi:polyisoprenoid-binding protein YceI
VIREIQARPVVAPLPRPIRTASGNVDPWGNPRIAILATTKINRKDFGLTWNAALETGGILVGDEVTITFDVEFIKA